MWPAVHIYPDIVNSLRVLSCYCSNSRHTYCNLVVQIFQFLFATLGLGITFKDHSENDLWDYVGLVDGRKSTGGYIFRLSGGSLFHQS